MQTNRQRRCLTCSSISTFWAFVSCRYTFQDISHIAWAHTQLQTSRAQVAVASKHIHPLTWPAARRKNNQPQHTRFLGAPKKHLSILAAAAKSGTTTRSRTTGETSQVVGASTVSPHAQKSQTLSKCHTRQGILFYNNAPESHPAIYLKTWFLIPLQMVLLIVS